MNAPESLQLPDIQSRPDRRNVRIDGVGIKGVRYPILIRSGETVISTVATFSMNVGLAPGVKGTHMSRFIEMLEATPGPLDQIEFMGMLSNMLERLDAYTGMLEMEFPYFVKKSAPVSEVQSLLDVNVRWRAIMADNACSAFWVQVVVPVTSLCPCSKEISSYGAHNQRSHVSIEAMLIGHMTIEELIEAAERSASCEVYGLLKRPDEKYVTERAYDNPKFVEDLVRDVVLSLDREPRIGEYVVEVENFESIHNHSAFARVDGRSRAARYCD